MTDAATAGLRARGTPAWPRFGHRLRGLIGGIGLAAAAAAQAAPANYQCTGYLPLKAEFTPRKAGEWRRAMARRASIQTP